ncbi:MAG: PEPxxWA-CTERM sorting domain-containing protein, partial [Proteobacteria bacterium]|nr:PEPxxWA-CTERM sorting domain-containing protein [Pseudomonadota bacterium]
MVAALAYEQSSDTLWGWDRSTSSLNQYATDGSLLQSQSIDVASYGVSNPWGGEMAMSAGAAPEPAAWALMILGFGAAGAHLRRRRVVAA